MTSPNTRGKLTAYQPGEPASVSCCPNLHPAQARTIGQWLQPKTKNVPFIQLDLDPSCSFSTQVTFLDFPTRYMPVGPVVKSPTWGQTDVSSNPDSLSLTSCMILSKLLNFSELPHPHSQHEDDDDAYFLAFQGELNEIHYVHRYPSDDKKFVHLHSFHKISRSS